MRKQVALNLSDRVHRNAHHDQKRSAAKVEGSLHLVGQDLGQDANNRNISRPD